MPRRATYKCPKCEGEGYTANPLSLGSIEYENADILGSMCLVCFCDVTGQEEVELCKTGSISSDAHQRRMAKYTPYLLVKDTQHHEDCQCDTCRPAHRHSGNKMFDSKGKYIKEKGFMRRVFNRGFWKQVDTGTGHKEWVYDITHKPIDSGGSS